jgi:putative addiction module CopG family antidote
LHLALTNHSRASRALANDRARPAKHERAWYAEDMAKTITLELDAPLEAFIAAKIQSGRYGSESEVLLAGLMHLKAEDDRQRAIFEDALKVEDGTQQERHTLRDQLWIRTRSKLRMD